ncbi:MAG: acetoacetate--CoA ligase [Parvularculaceae bacterium]
MTDNKIVWRPDPPRARASAIARFRDRAAERHGIAADADALQRWSVAEPEHFWRLALDFCGVELDRAPTIAIAHADEMRGGQFFPDAELNFARNLLGRDDDDIALHFRCEDFERADWSWRRLKEEVSVLAQALAAAGVAKGDRVGAVLPNRPEAIAAFLATASLGAIWTSCSPDFGLDGLAQRLGQTEPKILIASDGFRTIGKERVCTDKLADLAARLPGLAATVVVRTLKAEADISAVPGAVWWEDFRRPFSPRPIEFVSTPFNHPLTIVYSSGTTGAPKCIVHGAGGTLLQHKKEHQLHCDVRPGDRVFYQTTCAWMMWNWLVSALSSGASLVLYDGSPHFPHKAALFDLIDECGVTHFGVSAKYLDACRKYALSPRTTHSLESLRCVLSTGSPLAPDSFDYVYGDIKSDVHLASISGGSDIISCFVLGDPSAPVRRGEIQGPGLGMAVDVFDEEGKPVRGAAGELVCTRPFPSMPVGFWGEDGAGKYRAAYFEKNPGVWTHGDLAEITPSGGVVIHGRSDAMLNPNGVRIGTAEIYAQVERIPAVTESLAVGLKRGGDEQIVLFVTLKEGATLDAPLVKKIKDEIRLNLTVNHVPAAIIAAPELPRTKSGKLVELTVRDILHGRPVKNVTALANPEALDFFKTLKLADGARAGVEP